MLQHNDNPGFLHPVDANIEVPQQRPFGLYAATVQAVEVAVDPFAQEVAAETLKNWFLRHHPQEAQRLGHVPFDTWDRMARNRKRGYNEFLEHMGNTFQRRDATHARSRALPEVTADSYSVKWTAVLDWQKGEYHDNTSCFFSGNRVFLNGMANQGVTVVGFHDMEQGIGTGRVFVSPTWPHDNHQTPNGLLLWGGYGHLDDLGWMPVKPAADVMQAITRLPYRTDIRDNITWLGHHEPTADERLHIRQLPNNYNAFPQDEEPTAFDCITCKQHFPGMSARLVVARHENWDEDAYNEARNREYALQEKLQVLAHVAYRYTPTGRQSVPWAREYQALVIEADEANRERRRLGNAEVIEEITCMECHYAETLPAR